METGLEVSKQRSDSHNDEVSAHGEPEAASFSDEVYRGFFEHAVEGFFQTSPEGKYLRANPSLARIYGYESPQELMVARTDLNAQLYVDPNRRADFAGLMRNPGAVIGFESQVYRRDGSVIWISENARVVRDDSGVPILYEGTVQDITARKQAENELRTSQRFIERVAHSSPNILYVYDLLQQRYIYANDRIFKILGHTFSEVIEMGPDFLKKFSHADDNWLLEERSKELACAEDGVVFEYEFRLMHRAGDWRWINARETVFTRTAEGIPHEVIGTAQDITEQNNMVKALLQSEERFRKLVEGADAIFWEREFTEGHFIYVGPQAAKLLGYPAEDWYRRNFWLDHVHPEDRDRVGQFWQREVSKSAGDNAIEYRMETSDKRTIWVRDIGNVARDERGSLIVQGFMLDVTERQHAKEEIWKSQQQLRAFSAKLQSAREEERIHIAREIHDELGGALTALKMDISRIAAACSNACADSERDELNEKLSAMPKLIDRTMVTVRRIATELRPPVLDAFGLAAAIEWQASEFEKRFGVRCELENHWHIIVEDPSLSTAVFRIFQEILTNVARHSHASRVSIRMTEEKGNMVLTVSDNGRGITEGERRESLGLLGMRERAVMLGGDVTISGVAGKGTTVLMKIPVATVIREPQKVRFSVAKDQSE
jgi:PAS domain S-box-containing protein